MAVGSALFPPTRLLLSLFLLTISVYNVKSATERPNFVVFIVDDLGIGDIGCFGNDTIKTPNVDGLASQGVKLNHNLAPESQKRVFPLRFACLELKVLNSRLAKNNLS